MVSSAEGEASLLKVAGVTLLKTMAQGRPA